MTQQAERTFGYATTDVPLTGPVATPDELRSAAVPAPRSAPPGAWAPQGYPPPAGLGPMPGPGTPYAPAPRTSHGRTVGIVLGAIAGIAVLLICVTLVIGSLAASAVAPAPAAPPAPSSAPAVPSAPSGSSAGSSTAGTQQVFAPAGKRLDAARTTLDQQLTAASDAKDMDAFQAAFRQFETELQTYKASVSGLPMPADQQAAFSSLMASVDATLADCDDVVNAGSANSLIEASGQFDQHWTSLVTTHNGIIDGLAAG